MEKNKISTKMLRAMKVGEMKTVVGLSFKQVKSAQSISWQVAKVHGVKTQVQHTEKVDGTYEVTVKRVE